LVNFEFLRRRTIQYPHLPIVVHPDETLIIQQACDGLICPRYSALCTFRYIKTLNYLIKVLISDEDDRIARSSIIRLDSLKFPVKFGELPK